VVVHACNPSTQKGEAEGYQVQGQPGLYSNFQASMGYKKKFLKEFSWKKKDSCYS
jgi:hypothetical protein